MTGNSESRSYVKRRILKVLGAGTIGQALNMVIQLIKVPLFLSHWGVALYGEWIVVSSLPALLGASHVGFPSAASTDMILQREKNQLEKAQRTFQSTLLLLTCVVGVMLLITTIVTQMPLKGILARLGISEIADVQLKMLLPIFVLQFTSRQVLQLMNGGFRSEKRFVRAVIWTNAMNVAAFLGTAIGLFMGYGVVGVAALTIACQWTTICAMRLDLARCAPWIKLRLQSASWKRVAELSRPAMAYICMPLGLAMRRQVLVLIIIKLISPKAVVVFNTLRTLSNASFQLQRMVSRAIWPELSVAHGAGKTELVRELHQRAFRVTMGIAFFTSLGLLIAGPWLLHLWTQGKVPMHYPVFILLLTVTSINSLWITSATMAMSVNRHGRQAALHLTLTAFGLCMAILLTMQFGLSGAAMALLLIDIPMLAYVLQEAIGLSQDSWDGFVTGVLGRRMRHEPNNVETSNC